MWFLHSEIIYPFLGGVGRGQCLLVQADLNPAAEDDFGFLVLLSVPAGTKGCSR